MGVLDVMAGVFCGVDGVVKPGVEISHRHLNTNTYALYHTKSHTHTHIHSVTPHALYMHIHYKSPLRLGKIQNFSTYNPSITQKASANNRIRAVKVLHNAMNSHGLVIPATEPSGQLNQL